MCLAWSALTKDCPLGLASGRAVLRCRGAWGPGSPTSHSLLQLSAGSTLHMGLALDLQTVTWFWAQLVEVPAAGPSGDWAGLGSGLGAVFWFCPPHLPTRAPGE